MWELAAALLGVGLITIGGFLLFSSRNMGSRTAQGQLVALVLLGVGSALLVASLILGASNKSLLAELARAGLLQADLGAPAANNVQTPGAPAPQPRRLPYRQVTVLAWGTPSDQDDAAAPAIEAYSGELLLLLRSVLQGYTSQTKIAAHPLSREDYERLSKQSMAETGWCERYAAGLMLAVGVGTTRLEGQYALWREPVYEILDCRNARGVRKVGHVNERASDRFPYQLALYNDLANLLNEFLSIE